MKSNLKTSYNHIHSSPNRSYVNDMNVDNGDVIQMFSINYSNDSFHIHPKISQVSFFYLKNKAIT